jgi:hypothetical protein
MTTDARDVVIEKLWPESKPAEVGVYTILDTARDDRIYDSILSCGLESSCLYSGNIPEDLARVAPYLVRLEKEHPFTESIIEMGWGKSWGIFLCANAGISDLRKHFRSFLTVETEEGTRMVFRYYDPRVFRIYLPTCRLNELKTVFGPVRNFILETADASILVDFRLEADRLMGRQHSLIRIAAGEDLTP